MPDKSGPERYQEFYKFIATVDAAAIIAGLTLRRDLGIEIAPLSIPLISFGISGYLCILAMWFLTLETSIELSSRILRLHFWTALVILLFTTGGVTALIGVSIDG